MDFLLHWSVGFLLGTLIALPFITGRWVYDYDAHKWVQVRWGPVVDSTTARRYGIMSSEVATPELYPLTSSKFIIYHLLLANLCAAVALVPDVGQLFGNGSADHALWANIFFFHASIDQLPASTSAAITPYVFVVAMLVWLIVVTVALGAQSDSSVKESVPY